MDCVLFPDVVFLGQALGGLRRAGAAQRLRTTEDNVSESQARGDVTSAEKTDLAIRGR
jgi:hypothetical protein